MENKHDFAIGGQALIEGVMMRSPSYVSIAVRRADGGIALKHQKYISLAKRVRLLGLPIVRGIITLIETIILGMRALNFSAEVSLSVPDDPEKKVHGESWLDRLAMTASFTFSIIFSIALAIFLFKFVPLYLTEELRKIFPLLEKYTVLFNLTDGLIRISIFFLYIFLLSLFPSFQRVFQYHGAEHKSIFTYEKGHSLTPEHVKPESPRHPRCGTSFIIIVLIVSIIVLSLVPRHPDFFLNFLRRLSVIPVIMGAGYEILKWTAKRQNHPIMKFLTYPGIFTQYITTKEPDEKQIEVAIAALKQAVELENKQTAN